ncbi:MAG: MFS transporter [Nitrososphaeria archaeon]
MVDELNRNMYDIARNSLDRITKVNRAFIIIITLVIAGTFFDAIEQYNAGYAAIDASAVLHISEFTLSSDVEFITFAFMAIGGIIAGIMGDYLGRRFLYSFNLGIYAVGALISALAINFLMFSVGRAVVGLGLGGEIAVGLTLISEIMPKKVRGQFTGMVNVGPGIGIFAVALLALLFFGPYEKYFGGALYSWRWFLGVLILPALLILVYRRYIPETPRFLISKNKPDEAFGVIKMLSENRLIPMSKLLKVYDPESLRKEFNYLGAEVKYEKPQISYIFKGFYLKRSIMLFVLSFITFGISASYTIIYPYLFSGVTSQLKLPSTFILTTILNFGTLMGTIVAVIIAGHSRRMTISIVGFFAAIFSVGAIIFVSDPYMIIGFLFLFTLTAYASNTMIWLYAPEMYPTRTRNIGTGLILVTSLAAVAIMLYIISGIYSIYGLHGIIILTSIAYAAYAIIAVIMVEDTVMKDLEEVSPV